MIKTTVEQHGCRKAAPVPSVLCSAAAVFVAVVVLYSAHNIMLRAWTVAEPGSCSRLRSRQHFLASLSDTAGRQHKYTAARLFR